MIMVQERFVCSCASCQYLMQWGVMGRLAGDSRLQCCAFDPLHSCACPHSDCGELAGAGALLAWCGKRYDGNAGVLSAVACGPHHERHSCSHGKQASGGAPQAHGPSRRATQGV